MYEKVCNAEMKRARETIEFDYEVENNNGVERDPSQFRLGKRTPYAIEQLRVCRLLTNIYNCLNGCKSSSYKYFRCTPPKLEEYLDLSATTKI